MADPAAIEELAATLAMRKTRSSLPKRRAAARVVEKLVELGELLGRWRHRSRASGYVNFPRIIRFTVASSLKSSCKRRTLFYFSASSRHGIPRQKNLGQEPKSRSYRKILCARIFPIGDIRSNSNSHRRESKAPSKHLLECVKKRVSKEIRCDAARGNVAQPVTKTEGRVERRGADSEDQKLSILVDHL